MKILFVCAANVGRSQMAKAFYNNFINTNDADGAGTEVYRAYPDAKTLAEFSKAKGSSTILDIMAEKGIDVSDSPRTQLTPEMLQEYDLVVNIANKDQTPDWLTGENVIWWDIDDPGPKSVAEKIAVRDELEERVRNLIKIINENGDVKTLDEGEINA